MVTLVLFLVSLGCMWYLKTKVWQQFDYILLQEDRLSSKLTEVSKLSMRRGMALPQPDIPDRRENLYMEVVGEGEIFSLHITLLSTRLFHNYIKKKQYT